MEWLLVPNRLVFQKWNTSEQILWGLQRKVWKQGNIQWVGWKYLVDARGRSRMTRVLQCDRKAKITQIRFYSVQFYYIFIYSTKLEQQSLHSLQPRYEKHLRMHNTSNVEPDQPLLSPKAHQSWTMKDRNIISSSGNSISAGTFGRYDQNLV